MDFGSAYSYVYVQPEYEDISYDDDERGMNVSDSDSDDEEQNVRLNNTQSKDSLHSPLYQHKKGRRERRADTNIVSVKFDILGMASDMHTGDAVYCTSCRAILSHISEIKREENNKVWKCEFCGERNVIDIEDDEVPKKDDVAFMLEPALSATASGPKDTDESLIIFCIDISGSMYSLIEAVKAAVDHQFEEIMKNHPNTRVAIISFNDSVEVLGDGNAAPVIITGDMLSDQEKLSSVGTNLQMPGFLTDTIKQLRRTIFGLTEGGFTALGPAVLVAISMASQHVGSKVIICTDGLANVGLGQLDCVNEEDAGKFYEDIGNIAVSKGVCVSVTSFKDKNCKLVHLGKLADVTGGQVNILDPLQLTEEFSTIFNNNIIATNVVATFLIHRQLYFHYEETEESKVVREIGSVTANTEITFEYGVRIKNRKAETAVTKQPETCVTKQEAENTKQTGDIQQPETGNIDHQEAVNTKLLETEDTKQSDKGSTEKPETIVTKQLETGNTEASIGNTEKPQTVDTEQSETIDTKQPETMGKGQPEKKIDYPSKTKIIIPDVQKPEANGATAGSSPANSSTESPSSACQSDGDPSAADEFKDLDNLPFQLQIQYTGTDGAKALRVLTQTKPVTWDRKTAENKMKVDVIGKHTSHLSAVLAMGGRYKQSKRTMLTKQRMVSRFTKQSEEGKHQRKTYKEMFRKIKPIEANLTAVQVKEKLSNDGRTYSDCEDSDEEDDDDRKESVLVKKNKTTLARREAECEDAFYEDLYETKTLERLKKE